MEKVITSKELADALTKGEDEELIKLGTVDLPLAILTEFVYPDDAWAAGIRAKVSEEVITVLKRKMLRKAWLMPTYSNGKMGLKISSYGEEMLVKMHKIV